MVCRFCVHLGHIFTNLLADRKKTVYLLPTLKFVEKEFQWCGSGGGNIPIPDAMEME